MSEMVERVARAIHGTSVMVAGWDHLSRVERDSYLAAARAAIAAMRDPTFEMLNIGIDHPSNDIKVQWQAMIDEALR